MRCACKGQQRHHFLSAHRELFPYGRALSRFSPSQVAVPAGSENYASLRVSDGFGSELLEFDGMKSRAVILTQRLIYS